MIDRDRVVRARRRREALDSLAMEREREAALAGRLESALRDLEAWRADETAFARLEPDEVELLERVGFAAARPGDESRVRLEARAVELEAQLAESRRRQRAFERYAEALAEEP